MALLHSCHLERRVRTNQTSANFASGLTLLAGLLLALSGAAQENPRAAVRNPIPTEQLLEQQRSATLGERIRQVSTNNLQVNDDGVGASDSVELGEDEATELLGADSASETDMGAGNETDQSRRSRATNKHLNDLLKPVRQIDLRSGSEGRPVPENRAAMVTADGAPFHVTAMGYPVPPPDRYTICQSHRPLYFEQPNLERCGSGFGLFQNAVSGATFLANTIMLPYKAGKHRPDCEVPAGGDCKTCQSVPIDGDLLPIDRRGVTMELAAIAGFTFLLL